MDLKPKSLLGEFLVEENIISQEELETALVFQARNQELLGNILLKLKIIDEEKFYPLLARHLGVSYVSLKEKEIPSEIINLIPAQLASYYKVIPLSAHNGEISIATSEPKNMHHLDGLSSMVAGRIKFYLSSEAEIIEAIRRYYGLGAETIERMMTDVTPLSKPMQAIDNIHEIDSEASMGRFINQLLLEAYNDRASDIHIEPYEDSLQIRYRIDGVLYDAQVPSNIKHFKDSINSRIKILANLNIAEKRLPQDGRFKVHAGEVQVDFRVSFLPTPYGESVVIRILNQNKIFDLKELGLMDQDLKKLDYLIQRPHGIIFVTGPTGSGKTTTLYSCLSRVNCSEKKVLTIEDPIEYQLKGITQIQINPAIHLTFAQGLRSMLRHDPDIMMVGEVRDQETAEIAIQVALTGHLVFSTLHTNDAASGITRLLDMNIKSFLISSSVICFIAQRLVRMICPNCRQPVKPTVDLIKEFGIAEEELKKATFFAGRGCNMCQETGYHGR